MPLYLTKFSYTPETWARLIGNPEDRRKAAQSYIESVGGKLHGFWYAFGTHDGYSLWEAPDNVSMAAVALASTGGGALSSFETTVLLTVDETREALRKAADVQYRARALSAHPAKGFERIPGSLQSVCLCLEDQPGQVASPIGGCARAGPCLYLAFPRRERALASQHPRVTRWSGCGSDG